MEEHENACSICFEDYDRDKFEPRKLPCCHTYCVQCLEKMISDTGTITCPSDRSVHNLGVLGVFGLPLDSSKLKETNNRNIQSRADSVYFSSDFVDNASTRPCTAVSTVRQTNQPTVNTFPHNGHNTGYGWNYPAYNHHYQHPQQNSTYYPGIYAANVRQTPYQWSNHFSNPPMMVRTVQTTVTQYDGVHDLNIQTPSGTIQIRNGGNNHMINIVHF